MKNLDKETLKKMILELQKALKELEKIEGSNENDRVVQPIGSVNDDEGGRAVGTFVILEKEMNFELGLLGENQDILDVKLMDTHSQIDIKEISSSLTKALEINDLLSGYKLKIKN